VSLGDDLVNNPGDGLATDPNGLPTLAGPSGPVQTVPNRALVWIRSPYENRKAVRVRVSKLDEPFWNKGDLGKGYTGSTWKCDGSSIRGNKPQTFSLPARGIGVTGGVPLDWVVSRRSGPAPGGRARDSNQSRMGFLLGEEAAGSKEL